MYEIFKDFTRTEPKERLQKRLEISEWKSTLYFSTISHNEFEYYYNLFYVNSIKIVPLEIINLLTPKALAYWYMDDGSKVIKNNFFYYSIATCCFTIEEHKFLRKIFKDNFDMDVALHGLKSKRKTTTVYWSSI